MRYSCLGERRGLGARAKPPSRAAIGFVARRSDKDVKLCERAIYEVVPGEVPASGQAGPAPAAQGSICGIAPTVRSGSDWLNGAGAPFGGGFVPVTCRLSPEEIVLRSLAVPLLVAGLACVASSVPAQTPGQPLLPPGVLDSLLRDSTRIASNTTHLKVLTCPMPVVSSSGTSDPMPVAPGSSRAGDSMPVMSGNCSTRMPVKFLIRP